MQKKNKSREDKFIDQIRNIESYKGRIESLKDDTNYCGIEFNAKDYQETKKTINFLQAQMIVKNE